MSPEIQLTIAAGGAVLSTLVTFVIVALLIRLIGEQEDSAILCEIRLLREEVASYKDRVVNHNYIIYDHTRNAIVGDVPATVSRVGGITPFRAWHIDPKHTGEKVRVLAILTDGEQSAIF